MPDSGRHTHTGHLSIGLHQADDFAADAPYAASSSTTHQIMWAANPRTRAIVEHLLADIDLDAHVISLSGGERRRVALVTLLLADHDLLVLDEPTNHLDVEAVDWLAQELRALQAANVAMLVVSHDRWFLDAICTRIWEVHDGAVHAYDGGCGPTCSQRLSACDRPRPSLPGAATCSERTGLAAPGPAGPYLKAEVSSGRGRCAHRRRARAARPAATATVRNRPIGQGRFRS